MVRLAASHHLPVRRSGARPPGRSAGLGPLCRKSRSGVALGCLVDLDSVRGSQANKPRPAVLVSNDRTNTVAQRLGRGVVTVVPVTSNVEWVSPFQVLLPADDSGLRVDCKAQAEQVRSVAVERVGSQ